ncbi:MAG: twin-arginine translocase TatA/TatE family subunit [Proteobacteria bacterium]|nr:twin-arginine translocase TatA/TatE family subunit [Pseudomonadota bacterium]
MFGIGGQELILILVVALLVFGPKRLPSLARSLGRGLAEFRRASSDLRHSLSQEPAPENPPKPSPAERIAAPAQPAQPAQAGAPEPQTEPAPAADAPESKPDPAPAADAPESKPEPKPEPPAKPSEPAGG